jgi:uncharacterized membrane protein
MKAYVITTGAVFGLLVAAHVWRVAVEAHLATDPAFIFTTVVSAALCLWAVRLVGVSTRSGPR